MKKQIKYFLGKINFNLREIIVFGMILLLATAIFSFRADSDYVFSYGGSGGGSFSFVHSPTTTDDVDEDEDEPTLTKPIEEMTQEEIMEEIQRISALIAELRSELMALKGYDCTINSFERNLQLAMAGDDVKCLQIILNSDSQTKLAETGVGSPGNETNYFGPLTRSAVIKFQEKYADEILAPWNFASGTGFVGSTTRAKLNSLLGN